MTDIRLADVCAVALAELYRGDGEILGHAIGNMPTIGVRLARATFEPDLVITDGGPYGVAGTLPIGHSTADGTAVESWLPFRTIFQICFRGNRHIVMGASQLDRYGNQNIACIGDWNKPTVQLIGVRGAPANTINHKTSYWIPNHSRRVMVEAVDFVSGIGTNRMTELGEPARFAELGGVVTNLGVFDFRGKDRTLRLVSVHPGITEEQVRDATGFDLDVIDDLPQTRVPTREELDLLNVIDPTDIRGREVHT